MEQVRINKNHKKYKYQYKRKFFDHFYLTFYQFLKTFPITRDYIDKMGYRYRLISPCDSKVIAKNTVFACFMSWGLCVITFILIYLMNPRLITLITVVLAIVLIDCEVIGRTASVFELSILNEIQKMISNVIHFFYIEYRVDDAIYRSKDKLSPNMKKAAEQIYSLLLSENKEEALREYYENIPNKYLRTFVSQCVSVMERGDQSVDGKLLFVRNLENLQREIDIEIDKLQRLRMEFLGVILCVLTPIFCIDIVKQFAISIKENMATFFYGKEGFLFDLALLAIISGIYLIMRKSAEYKVYHQSKHRVLILLDKLPLLKKAMDNYSEKNASKMERLKRELRNYGSNIRARHFILRSFLLSWMVFLLAVSTFYYLHQISKEQLLTTSKADIELLTSAAKESQYQTMGILVERYTKRYVKDVKGNHHIQIPVNQEEMIEVLQEEGTFSNNSINDAIAREILRRINAYNKEHFTIVELFICFLLCIVTYYIPPLILKYNSTASLDAMEDEVNQFNALICMLMYVDGITVKQILEEMEAFAVVFKESLRICINNYGSGDMEALEEIKEEEPYDPFNRIVDNLIRCDDMPIYQAFHEIDAERDGYMAKRKLANEKSIRKRVFRAYILAAIPFILLFAYGLVPTLLSSINEINAMLSELESSAW